MNLFHGCPAHVDKLALDSAATFASQSLQMDSCSKIHISSSSDVPPTGSTVADHCLQCGSPGVTIAFCSCRCRKAFYQQVASVTSTGSTVESEALALIDWIDDIIVPVVSWSEREVLRDKIRDLRATASRLELEKVFK